MANKMNPWLLGGLVVVAAAFFLGWGPFAKDVATPAPVSTGVPSASDIIVCESATTPDLDINTYDHENPGTAIAEADNIYRKVGDNTWTKFTGGTAITNLQVGQKYEVVLGINSTTAGYTDQAYGPYFVTEPIACNELTTKDVAIYNDDLETGVTATFYNTNHDGAVETFSAGQIKTVYMKLEGSNDKVFGNPFIKDSSLTDNGAHRKIYPNMACMDLNSTEWDPVVKVAFGDVEMNRVSTPLRHTSVAGKTTYCYETPVITEDAQTLTLRMDADDLVAPTYTGGANVTLSVYPGGFFINQKTGNVGWGVEDENGNNVGTDAALTKALWVQS